MALSRIEIWFADEARIGQNNRTNTKERTKMTSRTANSTSGRSDEGMAGGGALGGPWPRLIAFGDVGPLVEEVRRQSTMSDEELARRHTTRADEVRRLFG